MSTNSTIKIIRKDGSETSIYCHSDGNIEHNGVILQQYFSTPEKVEELLALGDLSYLGTKLVPSITTHSFETPERDVTIAYHRDRGEEFHQSGGTCEFNYVYIEAECYWKVVKEVWQRNDSSEAQKLLSLDGVTLLQESLLLDEIMSVGVEYLWGEPGTEEQVLQDCIDKAKEARVELVKQQIAEWDAYYRAYAD